MTLNRRDVLCGTAAGALVAWNSLRGTALAKHAQPHFTMSLRCGAIGVRADLKRAIDLAHRHGFEAVSPDANYLSRLSAGQMEELLGEMQDKNLVWGAAGLPVEFRKDEAQFQADLKQLPNRAAALRQAGAPRVGTWIMPNHAELTYIANFKQHVRRLRECAKVLGDEGARLGFEYVGPKTLWSAAQHSFIHTLAETKELNAEIGTDNVGIILDSWHWYTAHESADDLRSLKNEDIIACDLNDAPSGIAIDEQIDNRRELPAATGVIDLKTFLATLIEIGYDGPIRAEPFNQPLNALDDEPAVAATAKAMRAAWALVE